QPGAAGGLPTRRSATPAAAGPPGAPTPMRSWPRSRCCDAGLPVSRGALLRHDVREPALDETIEKVQNLPTASVGVDFELLLQRAAQLIDAARLFNRIPDLGPDRPQPKVRLRSGTQHHHLAVDGGEDRLAVAHDSGVRSNSRRCPRFLTHAC